MARSPAHWQQPASDRGSAAQEQKQFIVKAVLQLTPEQEKLWPPVEEAIRARADTRYKRMVSITQRQSQQGEIDAVALLRERSDALAEKAAALKKLADAWAPLYQSLNPDQKQRMQLLAMRVVDQLRATGRLGLADHRRCSDSRLIIPERRM